MEYDQFRNKKSTYSESQYTTMKPDLNKFSSHQIKQAERVAYEIEHKGS